MKRFLSIFFCLALIFVTCSCSQLSNEDGGNSSGGASDNASTTPESSDPYAGLKKYTSANGISLYMDEGYTETQLDGVDYYMSASRSALSCNFETFEILEQSGLDTSISAEEYGQLVAQNNGIETAVKKDEYGTPYVIYESDVDGNSFTYYAYFVKGSDSFWRCNFICLTSEASSFEDDFALWASTIEIK